MQETQPPEERFMESVKAWRDQHPGRKEAYLQAIPMIVADLMAFEGDHVDVTWRGARLAHR